MNPGLPAPDGALTIEEVGGQAAMAFGNHWTSEYVPKLMNA